MCIYIYIILALQFFFFLIRICRRDIRTRNGVRNMRHLIYHTTTLWRFYVWTALKKVFILLNSSGVVVVAVIKSQLINSRFLCKCTHFTVLRSVNIVIKSRIKRDGGRGHGHRSSRLNVLVGASGFITNLIARSSIIVPLQITKYYKRGYIFFLGN